ncbi:MAG: hypothetical protein ABF377_11110 [Akkermansiaceae bacterium]
MYLGQVMKSVVTCVAYGVGIAGDIEPHRGHVFSVGGGGEGSVDSGLIICLGWISGKGFHFF